MAMRKCRVTMNVGNLRYDEIVEVDDSDPAWAPYFADGVLVDAPDAGDVFLGVGPDGETQPEPVETLAAGTGPTEGYTTGDVRTVEPTTDAENAAALAEIAREEATPEGHATA